jgi:site-specific recombinase XerD
LVFDNILVTKLSPNEAAGYLISLKASSYSPRYIEAMELALRLLTDYAEAQGWSEVFQLTASHIEDYLVYLRERPRWFGKRGRQKAPMSDSSVETHYRRLKTFFRWLVELMSTWQEGQ